MKKLFSNILIAALLAFNISSAALAESKTPADIMPEDIQLYFSFQLDELGETMTGFATDLIDSMLDTSNMSESDAEIVAPYYEILKEKFLNEEIVFGIMEFPEEEILEGDYTGLEAPSEEEMDAMMSDDEDMSAVVTVSEDSDSTALISEEDAPAPIYDDYYYDSYEDPVIFAFIPMSEEEYQTVENVLFAYETAFEESLVEDRTTYEDMYYAEYVDEERVYYNSIDDFYNSYIDGYMIITDYAEDIAYITDETISKLNENSNFQELNSALPTNYFAKFVLADFEELLDDLVGTPFYTEIGTLIGESITISETEAGFQMDFYASMEDTGVNTGELSLHNKIKADENLIFFSNSASNSDFSSLIQADFDYQYAKEEALNTAGVNLDVFTELFDNEVAFSVQNTGGLVPDFTMLAELDSDSDFSTELSNVLALMWAAMSQEASIVSEDTVVFEDEDIVATVNKAKDADMYTYSIELEYAEKENPYAIEIPTELTTWEISIGVKDDIFVFTNAEYTGEGGINHPEVQELLSTDSNSVMYFDFQTLNSYIQDMMGTIANLSDDVSEEEQAAFNSAMDMIFEPFESITSTGNLTSTSASGVINFNFDLDALITLFNDVDPFADLDALQTSEEIFDGLADPADDFSDISSEDWFADDVYYLNSEDIIEGYEDETFKPAQEITRAEFLKLVLEALSAEGAIYIYDGAYASFDDVSWSEWYGEYVDTAFREELISGYEDNTFRPNEKITRAEAAAILQGIIEYLALTSEDPITDASLKFNDISENDWFVAEVSTAYRFGLMKGMNETQFMPNKNLNRAETAALIRNLLDAMSI